ncbi:Transcriptional regulator, LysR family [hydrothermal vent metagenome]|uniref:Transcriptional regulator, LysR family n=1 Tax=hydrothermal vent metagenome TaxID=652676 RepID=A0A3B0Z066_9ZZZZ
MADRRLQVFHTVARLLSFTKAAETLHMTQPAVTFQVRQLEEHFNTRLFDRTHNRISLTEAGKQVFRVAAKIFLHYEEMEDAVCQVTGEISGALIIGASTTIAEYMLPAMLGEFKSKFPDVNVHLKVSNTDGIVSMIENNDIDLGVVEAPVSNKNLVVANCRTDQLVLITHPDHELAKCGSVAVKELLEHPYITREEGSGTREVFEDFLTSEGLSPTELKITMELGSPESIKGAVESNMGISVVSLATIAKELKLSSLCAVTLEPSLERPFSFVHQKQKFRHRSMDKLLEFAQNYCKEHQQDT